MVEIDEVVVFEECDCVVFGDVCEMFDFECFVYVGEDVFGFCLIYFELFDVVVLFDDLVYFFFDGFEIFWGEGMWKVEVVLEFFVVVDVVDVDFGFWLELFYSICEYVFGCVLDEVFCFVVLCGEEVKCVVCYKWCV